MERIVLNPKFLPLRPSFLFFNKNTFYLKFMGLSLPKYYVAKSLALCHLQTLFNFLFLPLRFLSRLLLKLKYQNQTKSCFLKAFEKKMAMCARILTRCLLKKNWPNIGDKIGEKVTLVIIQTHNPPNLFLRVIFWKYL